MNHKIGRKKCGLCKFILCISYMQNNIAREISDSHVETLSRQFNMDKKNGPGIN